MPHRPRIHIDKVPLHIVQRSHNREPCADAPCSVILRKRSAVAESTTLVKTPGPCDFAQGDGGGELFLRLCAGRRVAVIGSDAEWPRHFTQILYLLTLFAKGDKANLTKAERNELADLVGALVSIWKERTRS